MLGKVGKLRKGWQWVKLSYDEKAELYAKLMDENTKLLKMCYDEAKEICEEKNIVDTENIIKIARCLFDKIGTQSFSAINSALEKKIFEERQIEWKARSD